MRRHLLLVITSVGLTLVVVEFLLARFFPQKTMDFVLGNRAAMFAESDAFVMAPVPNFQGYERETEYDVAVELNSYGYRQAEFARQTLDQRRILVIGDSFTFGAGVEGEEAYPRLLEGLLDSDYAGRIEVINAGVPGRYVDEYYLELKERGLPLEPDLVLVGFFVGNDIDGPDARTHVWSRVDADGRPLQIDRLDARVEDGNLIRRVKRARWRLPVVRNSHVAQLLYETGRGIVHWIRTPRLKEDSIYQLGYAQATQDVVVRVQDLFLAMAEVSRQQGAEFLVVMIPAREQVYLSQWNGSERFDWSKPQRIFADFFTAHGIRFVDLLPLLRDASVGERVYFRDDGHWTRKGHVIAAHAIAEALDGTDILGPGTKHGGTTFPER